MSWCELYHRAGAEDSRYPTTGADGLRTVFEPHAGTETGYKGCKPKATAPDADRRRVRGVPRSKRNRRAKAQKTGPPATGPDGLRRA